MADKWDELWGTMVESPRMLVAEPDPDTADVVYIRDMRDMDLCFPIKWNGTQWMTDTGDKSVPFKPPATAGTVNTSSAVTSKGVDNSGS